MAKKIKTKKRESAKLIFGGDIEIGDTLNIFQKGASPFLGIVIKKNSGGGPSATFTIRGIYSGVGVEKIYPLYSPTIIKIERLKSAKVRRAKLYYLRDKIGKKAELKEKNKKTPKADTKKG